MSYNIQPWAPEIAIQSLQAYVVKITTVLQPFFTRDNREIYSRSALDASSIGQHIRHTLDYLESIAYWNGSDSINFVDRKRGTADETNPDAALQRLLVIQYELAKRLLTHRPEQVLRYIEATGNPVQTVCIPATWAAVVDKVFGHVPHHLEVIRLLAKQYRIDIDPDTCLAPATAQHQARLAKLGLGS